MSHSRLALAIAALVALLTACSDSTGPARTPLPAAAPPIVPTFPAPTGAATIYVEQGSIYSTYSLRSRFVLDANGTFALQFATDGPPFQYLGRYTRTDSLVTFDWDGWSVAGPWGATGILRGDELIVKYNVIMMLSDFEDGTYVRAPAAP